MCPLFYAHKRTSCRWFSQAGLSPSRSSFGVRMCVTQRVFWGGWSVRRVRLSVTRIRCRVGLARWRCWFVRAPLRDLYDNYGYRSTSGARGAGGRVVGGSRGAEPGQGSRGNPSLSLNVSISSSKRDDRERAQPGRAGKATGRKRQERTGREGRKGRGGRARSGGY